MRQLDWNVNEVEFHAIVEKIGKVEKLRIPRKLDGKSKGVGFVVFENKADADAAVEKLNRTKIRGREVIVEIAEARAKRTLTITAKDGTPGSRESSIAPDQATMARSGDTAGGEATGKNKKERTIALLNLQDTVSAPRLQKLVEQYGSIQRLSLRPDHGGAIIEFTEEKTVGLASLQLEGQELDGLKMNVGTVEELLASKPIYKGKPTSNKKTPGEGATKTGSSVNPFGSGVVRRPRVIGSQAGRKPGLGSKIGKKAATDNAAADQEMTDISQPEGKKSNADFRALMMGGNSSADKKAPEDDKIVQHNGAEENGQKEEQQKAE